MSGAANIKGRTIRIFLADDGPSGVVSLIAKKGIFATEQGAVARATLGVANVSVVSTEVILNSRQGLEFVPGQMVR